VYRYRCAALKKRFPQTLNGQKTICYGHECAVLKHDFEILRSQASELSYTRKHAMDQSKCRYLWLIYHV